MNIKTYKFNLALFCLKPVLEPLLFLFFFNILKKIRNIVFQSLILSGCF